MKYIEKIVLIIFILISVNIFSASKKCPLKLGEYFIVYNNKVFSIEKVISSSGFDELIEKKIRNLIGIEEKDILKVNGKHLFTKDKIFYLNIEIKNVDIDSFEILFKNVSKDKNNIYFKHEKIKEISSKDLKKLDKYHLTDGQWVYYITENKSPFFSYEMDSENFHIIRDVDIKTYEIINRFYSKDKDKVYYEDEEIEGVDLKTFEIVSENYAKDKNTVYYKGSIIDEADSKTFKPLKNGYSKDKKNIYWKHKKVTEYNNKNFKILDYGLIEIDTELYNNWEKAYKNDIKTLKKIGKYIWIDKNGIYYRNNERIKAGTRIADEIENFNFKKFKKLKDDYYIYDNSVIYYNDRMISKNIKNFKILSKNYSRDSENVYYKTEKIYNADLKTFEIVSENYAKDKDNVYYRNSRIKNINVKEFKKIDGGLIVDDSNIYDIEE